MQCYVHSFICSLIPSLDLLDVHFMWTRLAFLTSRSTLFMHNVREYTVLLSPSNWLCTCFHQGWEAISFVVLFPACFWDVPLSQVCMDYWCLETSLSGLEILMLQAVSTRTWRISCTALVNPHNSTFYLILLICVCCTVLVQICMLVFSDPEPLSSIQI